MRILVVEDDDLSRRVLITTLEALGHAVTPAADGREAWTAFQREPFPVVISDWMMPELDGLELCRRIRAADLRRYTYVVLLTAFGGRGRYLQGMDAGADDFLTKPLDPGELKVRLRVAERLVGLQNEVRQLEGLLPICAYCKRIRDAESWTRVEDYVASRTDATFTHGVCPECKENVLKPQLERLRRARDPDTP